MPDDEPIPLVRELEPARANAIVALLGAMGFDAAVHALPGGRCDVVVPPADLEAARRALEDEPLEESSPRLPENARGAADEVRWFGRGASALLVIALVCGAVFWSAQRGGAPVTRERLLEHGAISWSLVESGEVWRLVTAVFLHFDGVHLATNLLTMLLVAPPLADRLGAARFLVVFVLSGVAGNIASHAFAPSLALKAGASGAIAGVLGALAGQALRPNSRTRFRPWQIVGALVAVYAILVGAGAERDNAAHAGGLVAGLLLGRIVPPLE